MRIACKVENCQKKETYLNREICLDDDIYMKEETYPNLKDDPETEEKIAENKEKVDAENSKEIETEKKKEIINGLGKIFEGELKT